MSGCVPVRTPTQKLKYEFLRFSSQEMGSVSLERIFEALQSELFRYKFPTLSSKILKIPEFNLSICGPYHTITVVGETLTGQTLNGFSNLGHTKNGQCFADDCIPIVPQLSNQASYCTCNLLKGSSYARSIAALIEDSNSESFYVGSDFFRH